MPWVAQTKDDAAPLSPPAKKSGWVQALKDAASSVDDTVQNIGTGITKGLASTAGIPADLTELAGQGARALSDKLGVKHYEMKNPEPKDKEKEFSGTSDEIKDFLFRKLGIPEYKPKTQAGRVTQGVAEGVGGGVVGGPVGAAVGGMGGAGSSIAHEMFPKSKVAPIVGGLVGMGTGAGALSIRQTAKQLVADALKKTTPQTLSEARTVQSLGNQVGAPVTGPEALNNPRLLRLQQMAEEAPEGAPLRELMEARPGQQQAAVQGVTSQVGKDAPAEAAGAVKKAAAGAVAKVKGERTAASKPFYEAAETETIPAKDIQDLITEIDGHIARVGTKSSLGRELAKYKSQLQSAIKGDTAQVGPINAFQKELRERLGKPSIAEDSLGASAQGVMGPLRGQTRDALSRGSQNFAMGRQAHVDMTPPVTAMIEGPAGKLASQRSPTVGGQAEAILTPENMRPAQVTKIVTDLAKQDPKAPGDMLASYVNNVMDRAMKKPAAGQVQNAGGKFYSAIAGQPNAMANIRAAFQALPDGSTRWQAFNNVLKVLEAHSRRLAVGSPTNEKATITETLKGAKLNPQWIASLQGWVDKKRLGKNLGELAKIMAQSNSVDEMAEIARLESGSRKAQMIVGGFLGQAPVFEEAQKGIQNQGNP